MLNWEKAVAKKKLSKTNAIRLLDQKKIKYSEHSYEWSEDDLSAQHVALELRQPEEQVFKTLVTQGNKTGVLVAVISGNGALDLKKLAHVSGNKKVEMIHMKDLERLTGYIRGGCSPIGMKKQFPTFIDETAQLFDTIMISAGQRGLQIMLNPQDLADVVSAPFVNILVDEN